VVRLPRQYQCVSLPPFAARPAHVWAAVEQMGWQTVPDYKVQVEKTWTYFSKTCQGRCAPVLARSPIASR
jgi:hypothetical protein